MPARSRAWGRGYSSWKRRAEGATTLVQPPSAGVSGVRGRDPGDGHAGFAAGVRELDAGDAAVGFEEVGDAGEEGDVVVGVDAEVPGGDAAFGADGGGFGDDGARSTDCAAAEVDEVPVVGVAVDRAVLAHGGDDDAVGKGDAALLERREKVVGRNGHGGLDVAGVSKGAMGAISGGVSAEVD